VVIGDCQSCCVERVRHVSDTELLPKSKPDAVRRLEVFTGAGRRRTWSAEQKARIVAESYESGETVSVVARRHALTAQQLFGWRRAARRAIEEVSANGSAFTPVIVEAAPPCAEAPAASMARAEQSPMIEITIGIATVRFAAWIDPAALAAVLRALRAAT
jgi:transposase